MSAIPAIFLRKLLLFTVIVAIVTIAISYTIPSKYVTPTLPYLLVFFMAVTLIVHGILKKISERKQGHFINMFMLVTFGKLMFFLIVMLVYFFLYREDAVNFAGAFFLLYLLFTFFEVNQNLKMSQKVRKS